jgi:hypothetical protein
VFGAHRSSEALNHIVIRVTQHRVNDLEPLVCAKTGGEVPNSLKPFRLRARYSAHQFLLDAGRHKAFLIEIFSDLVFGLAPWLLVLLGICCAAIN